MRRRIDVRLGLSCAGVIVACSLGVRPVLRAQARDAQPAPAVVPSTAREAAPLDLTGYWVSVISEDWRWRMVTPAKGDYVSVPLTPAAKKTADTWDPAKDEAAGEQCRSYGAPALMRVPTRLHITWQDGQTLKVETDAGTQTRLLHFGLWRAPAGKATWQGHSVAEWQGPRRSTALGGFADGGLGPSRVPGIGSLKVTTTHIRAGYLRKNGIPYSADALLTEYWDLLKPPNGDQWMVITTIVHDPVNLQTDYITSPNFKKEPDGSKWDPSPCSSRW